MTQDICKECKKPLEKEEDYCKCEESVCYNCCRCEADCECGCIEKSENNPKAELH